MQVLFYTLLGIIGLFFIFLSVKGATRGKIKEKFCVICLSVFFTWIVLLLLYWRGVFNDSLIIGILIGESILGIYYVTERKVKKDFLLFRLPFLLTLIVIAYLLINIKNLPVDYKSLSLLAVIWILFFGVYTFRSNNKFRGFVEKVISCCKDI